MFDEVTGITRLTFPWGEKYSIPNGVFNSYNFLLDFTIILFVVYMINAFFILRRRERNIISIVWAALVILILAAIVNDYLIAKGRINSLYLLELSLAIFLIVMCVVIITETYEELAMLEKVKERLHSYESMIENVDLIIVSLNRMGNVEYVNPFYLELTGYEPDEVLGKDWFANFIPQTITYDTQGVFLEVLKNDFEPHYENPIVLKNGNSVHVKWHNVRLVDMDGKVSGSLSIGIPAGEVNGQRSAVSGQRPVPESEASRGSAVKFLEFGFLGFGI
jgi:PAS domain S-box-containing protein